MLTHAENTAEMLKYYTSKKSVSRCHSKCYVCHTMCPQCLMQLINVFHWSRLEQHGGFNTWQVFTATATQKLVKFNMQWRVGLRGSINNTVRCKSVGTDGGSSFIPTGITYLQNKCSYFTLMCFGQIWLWKCILAGKQTDLVGMMLFGCLYWPNTHKYSFFDYTNCICSLFSIEMVNFDMMLPITNTKYEPKCSKWTESHSIRGGYQIIYCILIYWSNVCVCVWLTSHHSVCVCLSGKLFFFFSDRDFRTCVVPQYLSHVEFQSLLQTAFNLQHMLRILHFLLKWTEMATMWSWSGENESQWSYEVVEMLSEKKFHSGDLWSAEFL